ncbi:PadR family transcriptional regulator [Actinomadura sp. DC4]|uniref:PadR family transcriptional regulator n=1 Tax=Actinomadura sp. DC4 TaxID=3055069 RepID=UPI0025B0C17D|nr:PadR family transcriptional regulator [Actinomadura sp. DC4]MDN3355148.1 PadR family transcriptional regulator [Actinomadura sp. DC4]
MTADTEHPLTPAVFALLLALHAGERHGYALMGDVSELTGGSIVLGPATLYRSLQRMRVDGLVEELDDGRAEAARADRRAERRRSYRITPAGRASARAEARRLARLVEAAAGLGVLNEREG